MVCESSLSQHLTGWTLHRSDGIMLVSIKRDVLHLLRLLSYPDWPLGTRVPPYPGRRSVLIPSLFREKVVNFSERKYNRPGRRPVHGRLRAAELHRWARILHLSKRGGYATGTEKGRYVNFQRALIRPIVPR